MFIVENSEKHGKLKITLGPPPSISKLSQVTAPSLIICVCFLCCQNKQNHIPHIVSICMFSIEISHVLTVIVYSDVTWRRKIKTILSEKGSTYAFMNLILLHSVLQR